jgi:DNA-directed RNA polymerase subunit RPC12/RpoP
MPTSSDPFTGDDGDDLYECLRCGNRQWSTDTVVACPDCGGTVQNLSRPRPE